MKRRLLLLLPALLAVGQPKAAAQPLPAPARPYWTFSLPAPRPIDAADTLTLRFIGDVMMHRPQLKHDYTAFFRHVAAPMRSADIAVVNMEFPLAGPPYTGYPSFSAPDAYAWTVCADLSLDVALLSNNHILDKGRSGVERTLAVYDAVCDSLGTLRTGVSRDAAEDAALHPALIRRKGISVAFVNFTYGNNVGPQPFDRPRIAVMEEEEVAALVARARGRGADFVIALPHWGNDYGEEVTPAQRAMAKKLAEWGADAVIGTNPHELQEMEIIDNTDGSTTLVAYSLGNFSYPAEKGEQLLGGLLSFELVRNTGTNTITLENIRMRGVVTHYGMDMSNVRLYMLDDYTSELANVHAVSRENTPDFGLRYLKKLLSDRIDGKFLR